VPSGSALAAALAHVFASPLSGGRTRQLFVLLADEAQCDDTAEVNKTNKQEREGKRMKMMR
jgi:hypothetical protein